MNIAGEMSERKERPAYVKFERRPMEDKVASLKAGHYVAKDVDYAIVTAPYSKDEFVVKVESWFAQMKIDVANGKIPAEWQKMYKDAYGLFQNGQEVPLNGTAIRGWGVISPAQQETLTRMHILTVEDLAAVNDEGLKRIGMGAMDLKNKAKAWLAQLQDKGPITVKMASLEKDCENLKAQVQTLVEMNEKLQAMIPKMGDAPVAFQPQSSKEIEADDLLDEPPPKRGKR